MHTNLVFGSLVLGKLYLIYSITNFKIRGDYLIIQCINLKCDIYQDTQ